jgi:hypothetical protein
VAEARLVRIPRELLHVDLDGLERFGVNAQHRAQVRALLADLPLVPDASASAQLSGPPGTTRACLAVVARHVGQGLRDTNLAIAHDRERLRAARHKLVFLSAADLETLLRSADQRIGRESALFVTDLPSSPGELVLQLLASRTSAGLASFVTAVRPVPALEDWRRLELANTGQPL